MDARTNFMVLDYQSGRIIKNLNMSEVLVTAYVLMQLKDPSFDIVEFDTKKFVTAEFVQDASGHWRYSPAPVEAQSS